MNAIFLATNLSDTVRDTGELFGWDPKLFFSQVISFIIVAYLLKRFAYKPILVCSSNAGNKLRKRI